jgi:hypothetical protein
MLIVYKTIMLAAPAKAIAGRAQYCVNETSYCVSQTSKIVQRSNIVKQADAGGHKQTCTKISLLQH